MVEKTPNHGLNKFERGDTNWSHEGDMETAERRLPVRDIEANLGDYTPHEGAIFIATDSGAVYDGDGEVWNPATRGPNQLRTGEEPAANVKYYGAAGDGVADDTSAIQTAVDSCPPGGTVYLPGGTYNIAGRIVITTADVTIRGPATIELTADLDWMSVLRADAPAVTVEDLTIEVNRNAAKCIRFNPSPDGLVENCTVRNIENEGRVSGIRVEDSPHAVIRDCTVENIHSTSADPSRGIKAEGNANDGLRVENCIVRNVSPAADGDGIRVSSMRTAVVDNFVENCDKRAIKMDAGSHKSSVRGNKCVWDGPGPANAGIDIQSTECEVAGNHVEADAYPSGRALEESNDGRNAFVGNTVISRNGGGTDDAIQIRGSGSSCVGNTIEMNGGHGGIRIRGTAENVTIGDNVIQGTSTYGIEISDVGGRNGPTNVTVSGNVVDGGDFGVFVEDGTRILIDGNVFDTGSDLHDPNSVATTGTNV